MDGEYTFVGGTGLSVIDYGLVSLDALYAVKGFRVEQCNFSYHMPLVYEILFQEGDDAKNVLPMLPKLE